MEAGGDTAAVCENASGKNGDVLKIAKLVQELNVYKWVRSKIRLEMERCLLTIAVVKSWKSLPTRIQWLLPKWRLVKLWNGFICCGASGRPLSPGSLFLFYICLLKLLLSANYFPLKRKVATIKKTWRAHTQSIHQQSGKGSISLFVTVFSGLLRSLLSWPLNCNMYTYYRQN